MGIADDKKGGFRIPDGKRMFPIGRVRERNAGNGLCGFLHDPLDKLFPARIRIPDDRKVRAGPGAGIFNECPDRFKFLRVE